MMRWNERLHADLDGRDEPLTVFFRDDDVGQMDEQLLRLLDLFVVYETPIDLAVIPHALETRMADTLLAMRAGNSSRLGLHQHGFRHVSHEHSARKCEFGSSRTPAEQRTDLLEGRERLRQFLFDAIDPIFTPPWNRCTQATADGLASLGFRVLSRNVGAAPLMLNGMTDVSVTIDWSKDGAAFNAQSVAQRIGDAIATSGTVGIMLHHAVMNEEQIVVLEELLDMMHHDRRVECRLMREVAALNATEYALTQRND